MLSAASGSRFRAKQTSWNTKGGGVGGGEGEGGQMGEDKNETNLFDALFCFIIILECRLISLT